MIERGWRAALLALCWIAAPAGADTVRVLAAGAAKHAVEAIAPAYELASGDTVAASFDTVGAQRDRVLNDEPADVVILSDAALARLHAAGKLAAGPAPAPIGRVVVALAVPAGQPAPDLGDAAALRAALLAAPSIAYADPARGATAGTHFAKVIEALGLRETLAPKITVLPFGVDVIQAVAAGRIALGVSQSSEIVQHAGVKLAGGLPAPHDQATGYALAVVRDSPAAQAFVEFATTQAAALAAWRASGFTPP